jgi:4-diphosphocytidyl-2-C-methyl-D-erythritol kinase
MCRPGRHQAATGAEARVSKCRIGHHTAVTPDAHHESGPLRLEAPAKLNLSLRVVGRRDDGLHELDSHFVLLELADRLLLLPGCSGLRIEGEGAATLPLGAENLAWQGLAAGLGGPPDLACLALEKRIPAAAGLAGGSSDAAASWRLGRRWVGASDRPIADDVATLAAIGADVPFFASGVAEARVTGIGETITPLQPVPREVVLVHPPFGLSTRDVFAELRPDEWGARENDLLTPARRLRPELDDLFALVADAGGRPRLTGSGPTIFHLAEDAETAAALAERLTTAGLRVTHTRTRQQPATIDAYEEDAE